MYFLWVSTTKWFLQIWLQSWNKQITYSIYNFICTLKYAIKISFTKNTGYILSSWAVASKSAFCFHALLFPSPAQLESSVHCIQSHRFSVLLSLKPSQIHRLCFFSILSISQRVRWCAFSNIRFPNYVLISMIFHYRSYCAILTPSLTVLSCTIQLNDVDLSSLCGANTLKCI